jgi:sorbitol-6-phosphate 2-dehydrogenase
METARQVEALGVPALGVTCDSSDEAQVEALVKRVVQEFGRLDILVNTVAWIEPPALIREMRLENWENTLRYDLTTHFLACKHAVNVMIAQNYGRIVNVSSEAGKGGYRLRGAYCAAKAGVIALSQTLAVETAEYDIRVNAICPRGIAGVRLDTIRQLMAEYRVQRGTAVLGARGDGPSQPERRSGAWGGTMDPAEVAEVILWLVSPAGSRINGQAISIG